MAFSFVFFCTKNGFGIINNKGKSVFMPIQLSIGAAVYNIDEPFLRAFIEGVMRQLTDETELLLIDDCSRNNSGDVCRSYAARDSRIRYIRMEQNGGLSRVRNRTIAEAAGKWIFFADGDDLLSDHFVESALRFCDADYDIIIHDRLKFVEEKGGETPCEVTELTVLPQGAGRALSVACLCMEPTESASLGLSSRAFYHAAWGAVYRKAFLTQNSLRFPDGQKKAQDSVFNTRAYYAAQKIAYLPYVMYYYRNNPQGITRRYSADLPEVEQSLLRHLDDCMQALFPDDADVRARYLNHRITAMLVDLMRLHVFHKDNPQTREQRKQAFLSLIGTEPYATAIRRYDPKASGRWEWHLPITLMRKKRFAVLDAFMGNDAAFRVLCGADKRLAKLLK